MLYLCINKNDKDMKHNTTHTFLCSVPRSFDKSSHWAEIDVDEYATFFSVTIHLISYACPSVVEWKVPKDSINRNDPYMVAQCIIRKAYIRGNI